MNNSIYVPKGTFFEPGKTVKEFVGVIRSFTIQEWGIEGKAVRDNEHYKFRIKRNVDIKDFICSGLTIKIINGFCVKNRKRELIITDGKFGEVILLFDLENYFFRDLNERKTETITGIIRDIKYSNKNKTITIEHGLFRNKNYIIEINDQIKLSLEKKYYLGKTVKIKFIREKSKKICTKLEILQNDDIFYKIINADKNPSDLLFLIPFISKQQELMKDIIGELIGELVLLKGTLSRINRQIFEDIIYDKINNGKLKPLCVMFLPDYFFFKYFEKMVNFIRKLRENHSIFNSIEDILNLIKYYYPPLEINI